MILSGCYHEKGYSPLDGFVSYDTYYANDMLPYLAQHYNAYYNLRASQYSSIDPVKRYADLNAILTSTSIYYDEVKTYRYDEYGMPIDFGIVVAEETDASRRIVVSTVQPDYEETQAIGMLKFITHDNNIYISRADNNVCVQDSIMQFKENQKVDPTAALMDKFVSDHISQVEDKLEDGMKSGVETASKTAFGLSTKGPLAVYGFISGYVDEYNETVESNQKLEQDITYEEYSKYYNNLYMGGNVACCGSQDILFLNEKIDENQMQINLSYYNYEQGTNYSVEHMQEQYNNFTVGGDSSDLELYSDNLCNGDSGTQNMQNYNNAISIELGNTYVSTASEVQLQQAIENVNNRIDYYVEDILGKDISSASQEEIQNALNQVLSQPDTYNLNKDPEDMK